MTPEDSYQTPFDTEESSLDAAHQDASQQEAVNPSESLTGEDRDELDASRAAWEDAVDGETADVSVDVDVDVGVGHRSSSGSAVSLTVAFIAASGSARNACTEP